MYCDECKKNPATIHYTKVVNGHKEERHLCEACASKLNMDADMQMPSFPSFKMMSDFPSFGLLPDFSMADFVGGFFNPQDKTEPYVQQVMPNTDACPVCGMTAGEFKKLGRVGCPNCYKHFGEYMPGLLRRIHGTTNHVGKVPAKGEAQLASKHKIEQLRSELKAAINREDFEQAAKLRDEIKNLEKGYINGGGQNA